MKLTRSRKTHGFTLAEIMIAVGLGSSILTAIFLSATALRKSMAAIDSYFSAHVQQIRIIDYLSRDVKRSTIVRTSADRLTIQCWMPKYVVKATDPDGIANPALVGTRRNPVITNKLNVIKVDYGTPDYTVSPPTGVTEVDYYLSGNSIVRKEDNTVTTIASSTDQLIPDFVDVDQSNTEYTISAVTFMPTFILNSGSSNSGDPRRLGTSVYSLAYLRNMRRGN